MTQFSRVKAVLIPVTSLRAGMVLLSREGRATIDNAVEAFGARRTKGVHFWYTYTEGAFKGQSGSTDSIDTNKEWIEAPECDECQGRGRDREGSRCQQCGGSGAIL